MSTPRPDDWPGWEHDEELAARHAGRISHAITHAVAADALVRRWLQVTAVPQRTSIQDAEAYVLATAGGQLRVALLTHLEALWHEAWELGGVAAEAARSVPAVTKASDGDQDTECLAGHQHWGRYGCAGLLIRAPGNDGYRYLLQYRPEGTWGIWGGAVGSSETPFQGAMREAREEMGAIPAALRLHHTVVDDHGGWTYTTHVMDAQEPFQPSMTGSTPEESEGWGWFTEGEMRALNLHHGFAESWDRIRDTDEDTVISRYPEPDHTGVIAGHSWPSGVAGQWRGSEAVTGNNAQNVVSHGKSHAVTWWPGQSGKLPAAPLETIRKPGIRLLGQLTQAGMTSEGAQAMGGALDWWIQSRGTPAANGMVRSMVRLAARVLEEARLGRLKPHEAAHQIRQKLDVSAKRIAATETAVAAGEAARLGYVLGHIRLVRWATERDKDVCAACQSNADAGPVILGQPFPTGNITVPAHPHCRCALLPAKEDDVAVNDWLPSTD